MRRRLSQQSLVRVVVIVISAISLGLISAAVPAARSLSGADRTLETAALRNAQAMSAWVPTRPFLPAGIPFYTVQLGSLLPVGWDEQDIGSPALSGSASESGGVFAITGAGADIWYASDQFHFVYQPLTGDGTITARVASLGATDVWAKAGVMMRETLTTNSKHAFALISAARGSAFQRRPTTGGLSVHTGSSGVAPHWVRLKRTGDLFEALHSIDGVNWQSIGSQTIGMLSTIYVGFSVTSHNIGVRTTATISNVTLLESQPGNQPPTVSITSPANGAALTPPGPVTVSASAMDADGAIASVAFYADSTPIGTDTTAPYAVSWSNISAGTHRLTAVATDSAGATTTSAAVNVSVTSPPTTPGDIVIHAEDVTLFRGAWTKQTDSTAADGLALATANLGKPTVATALAAPVDYFDLSFDATANTTYRVWLRLRGTADSKYNESVWVQFSDSLSTAGVAKYRIGTTSALLVNLEDCAACGIHGWGWQRHAYWLADTGDVRFATTGTHTMRVQVREDGVMLDQIVLSPTTYLTTSPGAVKDDTTIVPRGTTSQAPTVAIAAPVSGATFTAPANITVAANATDADGTVARVDFYSNGALIGTDSAAPYSISWNNVTAGSYSLTAAAIDDAGNRGTSAAVAISVGAPTNQLPTVALTTPASGTSIPAPATVSVAANAADTDGTIARVDFYAGTTLIGTRTTSPYQIAWSVQAAGTYSVTARATDNSGGVSTSAAMTVIGRPAQAIFTASADDAMVTNYLLEIFAAGATPGTTPPVASQNLGRPPVVNGEITTDVTAALVPLAPGTYFATVSAVNAAGSSRSAASATFTR